MARSGPRGSSGQLRIIGGTWRGRKLRFNAVPGLRPTADRNRETLFNWLAPVIRDARCLDLFAGSGALGLEALSRGASHCDFVDRVKACTSQIQSHLNTLGAPPGSACHTATADRFLQQARGPYDIIFLDPPFEQNLIGPTCELLESHQVLNPGALIYTERGSAEPNPVMPASWIPHREKASGGVIYALHEVPKA